MRIAFSNIAWELSEEEAIARLISGLGVESVDIAPGKYFPDPDRATDAEMRAIGKLWSDRGFAIEGMQALLFGTTGLNLFSDAGGQMFNRLAAICRIGGGVGARALTFGSPRQRDRSGLNDEQALEIATDFFGRIGDEAARHGVVFCLEPNPRDYNCNFMMTAHETAAVVRRVGHPAVRMQLDVGAIAMNGESAEEVIREHADLIGHVHASEPNLVVLGDAGAPHMEAATALRAHRPDLTVTIEMAPANEPHEAAVRRALAVAQAAYAA